VEKKGAFIFKWVRNFRHKQAGGFLERDLNRVLGGGFDL